VRIVNDRTLLMPERPGNRLADSLRNMLANPHIGLLFIVPGVTDTFRVNGRGTITTDAALLAGHRPYRRVARRRALGTENERVRLALKRHKRSSAHRRRAGSGLRRFEPIR
jgi:predicted pyridoxine 5'-phosphate oxidase superfamily flavin-nucleotide-binding protein